MPRYNPFRPGSIVTPGMFSGRSEEILALEQSLFQTRAGNPNHFLIQGERGIGKSSLLFYLQCVARGDISSLDEVSFRFVTVSIVLEPADRKSTRLNSSHITISYAVFCLKKKR